MTDIEQYTAPANGMAGWQPAQQVVRVQPRTVVALTEWAQAAQAAYEVAQRLVTTSFVPEAFRDKPAEAAAAILAGDEVGLSPMAALRSFDIIQGTAAPRAMTQRAIVQAKGHEIWLAEATDTRCIVKGRRAGASEVQESVWDLARARGLNLLGKRNWKDQPQAMLIARATAECCRLVASDALLGIPYAIEEIADGALDDPYRVADEPAAKPAPATGRTAQRRNQPKTAPSRSGRASAPPAAEPESAGPPLPGEDGYEDQPAPPTSPADELPEDDREATKKQLTKIGAFFTEHGFKAADRDQVLAIVRELVQRDDITSRSDLTLPEAGDLIEQLEELAVLHEDNTANELRAIAPQAQP